MITQLERERIVWIYSFLSKFPAIPFTCRSGKFMLKQESDLKYWNYITWILILLVIAFHVSLFPFMLRKENLNMLVQHGSVFLAVLVLLIAKLNIWIYKPEMVKLMNEVFYINKHWGMN